MTAEVDRSVVDSPFRFPVQLVLRPSLDFRGYAGQIVSGTVRPGDAVTIWPSGRSTRVKRIVMMGGGFFEGGNITPAAEFNIYVDPEAASEIFGSGVDIVMMPLDVTHKATITTPRMDVLRQQPNAN